MNERTHIDLFTGIGGFSIASRLRGIATEVMCEKNKQCRSLLSNWFPEIPIVPDVREFKAEKWPERWLLTAGDPAPSEARPGPSGAQNSPTFPDMSLPWSLEAGPGGWSAKMFLHQMMSASLPDWKPLDTERLLSGLTPIRLRVSAAKEITLSALVKTPGFASGCTYRTSKMVQGLIRRALARNRSFRLLLRTERDTTPVIVTFGTADSASWTLKSEKPLPDSLKDGLLDFLRRHAPECSAMQ